MTTSGLLLAEPHQKMLLGWAREVLQCYLPSHQAPELPRERFPSELMANAGAFVTLHRGDELRGCIGTFQTDTPLLETVRDMAIAAATQDPRFSAVPRGELDYLQIEISVLSPRWVTKDALAEIEIGRHGICIARGWYRGVLLPQVATEYDWDAPTFLAHTCRKAGLPMNAWQQPDTKIELFTAQVFGEEQAPGEGGQEQGEGGDPESGR